MNARSDADLHRVISEGGLATGRSWLMPRFGSELEALDVWDVLAYVRTLHPTVADVVPDHVVPDHLAVHRKPGHLAHGRNGGPRPKGRVSRRVWLACVIAGTVGHDQGRDDCSRCPDECTGDNGIHGFRETSSVGFVRSW